MTKAIPDIENDDMTPRAVATAWFSRQRSGGMAEGDREALRAWLDADPTHLEAYREVRGAWAELGAVRAHPRVMTMREDFAVESARRRRWFAARAMAACVALAFVVLSGGAAWQWWMGPKPLGDHRFATAFGERATITLADGSELTLNTDTVVRTRADGARRLVYLDKGQAYFKVAKDKRHPFVVTAAGRTVTALGTAFDVRVDGGALKVVLVEGKVRVEAAAPGGTTSKLQVQATEMTPGSQLLAPGNGELRLIPTNAVAETSWTKGQLIFDDEPLKDVVAELNRYTHRHMIVPDAALRDTTISGNFKPGDVEGFVYALEQFGVARGVESGDEVELRPLS